MPDLTTTPGAVSGARAFAMAGVGPTDVDVLMGYDSFTITALLHLEDLGFCAKGEGGPFAAEGGLGPGGLAPHEHQRRRALVHPPRHVRDVPAHRGRAPAARRVRRSARSTAPTSPSPTARACSSPSCRRSCSGPRPRCDGSRAPSQRPARFEPPVGAESGPFWEATREGRLLVQWCTACDRGVFYPRVFCPYCGAPGSSLEWREAAGRATVHAAVVEHRPEAAGASFAAAGARSASPWSTWRRGCA